MKNTTPRWKVLAAAASTVSVPLLAACGSGDANDAGAESTGDTIKVMVYGPIDAKAFSIPGIETGARAGVDKVNEEGGIGGRDLELIVCNDNNDPNTAAGCARQAVQEKVVAVIGGLTTFEPQMLPPLEQAGIPVLGATAVSTFDASNLYPIAGGAPAAYFALGKYMVAAPECEGKVGGVIEDFAAAQGAIQLLGLGVQASGGEFTGFSSAPQGASDFAPAVAAAVGDASCLGYVAGPQTSPLVLSAITANGGAALYGASESIVPSEVLAALGEAGDGNLAFSSYLPLNDTTETPEMKEFLERGEAIDADFSPEQTAASAYLSSLVLREALDGSDVSDLTAADVIAALDQLAGFETGMGPIVDFTVKNPTKAFSRMPYSTPSYQWVSQGGQYVLGNPEPISIEEIYDAASAAGQ